MSFTTRNGTLWAYGTDHNHRFGASSSMPIWSIGPTVRKDFLLTDKFGAQASFSIPLNYIDGESYDYSGNPFNTLLNADTGNAFVEIDVSGRHHIERQFSIFLRPEAGVFYKIGNKGRLTLDAMWGINTGKPLVTREFDEITYNDQTYHGNHHVYDGQYWAFTIGYEHKIR
ncbi:hypothetical protein FKX85_12990 [Echinicola soli]|uniref:Uncharacterized protein n=1 Tax=Echinicola soli TaxID=2591634 RepID=A0A514CJ91_9BACT|nr:hypothetical protein [Echinicola soli]QDH79897.1 hypothetical protein FKX85_12990 [Echinicola soli]